jgi:hypothetical protein
MSVDTLWERHKTERNKTMEDTLIFGYTWKEIQARQQNTYAAPRVACEEMSPYDLQMIEQYKTPEALEEAGYLGTAARLRKTI